ncbi:MAG: ABC transporter substrate-binding protein, partial [Alphaproteobacteria bacterium]
MRFAYFATSLIFFILGPHLVSAFEIEGSRIYPAVNGNVTLKIISTADINVFEPIILEFQREHPTINIEYVIASSTEL